MERPIRILTTLLVAVLVNALAWPIAWVVATSPDVSGLYLALALIPPILGIAALGWAVADVLSARHLPLTRQYLGPLPLTPGYVLRGRYLSPLRFSSERHFEVGLRCERRSVGGPWRTVWREERSAGSWPVTEGTVIEFNLRTPAASRLPAARDLDDERWHLVIRMRSGHTAVHRDFLLPRAAARPLAVAAGAA